MQHIDIENGQALALISESSKPSFPSMGRFVCGVEDGGGGRERCRFCTGMLVEKGKDNSFSQIQDHVKIQPTL